MARWEPRGAERLVAAALELFEERGYDGTTVVDIAERAGLTKSTFFRHFPDKRAVLFGGDTLSDLLVRSIEEAPAEAGALSAVLYAFERIGGEVFTADRRELNIRRAAVIAAAPELQEREALKQLGLVAAMVTALRRRGVPELAAAVTADVAALASKIAYERWAAPGADASFSDTLQEALDEVRTTFSSLS
ncbi:MULTISPECIES: TetR/AcrR family transcriptional regulator [unclassified Nocardiopsis]|uniref:TetR/AcrR family transcriptional regulator n=1 Tax=Nocardiopsis TaxID=2013 RepID=UPI00387B8C19